MIKCGLCLIFAILFSISNVIGQNSNRAKTLDEGLSNLSEQISDNLSENRKRRIAVTEFVDLEGETTNFGRYLSEKLITKLFQTKKFRVIERQQLNKVIKEQKLSLTGIIEPESAQKLGRLLGVDAIAAGSVTELNRTVEINARLIDTETGEVFSVASVEISKDETVCSLLKDCPGGNAGSGTDSPGGSPENSGKWAAESNFFTFELLACRKSSTFVSCDLTITNNSSIDRKLGFEWKSNGRMFDQQGLQSTMSDWLIANQSYGKPVLLPDVPTKGNVSFKKVSPQATMIKKMELALVTQFSEGGYYKTRDFVVAFENIPLQ
jgi:curli biogenesis system outer membrane secretion channel CsgG